MIHRVRAALQPAWLLRTQPYRDTSLLIEAYSRDSGRVGLMARGVRGPRSRSRGLLQPLRPLLLSWTASGELGTVSGAEADGAALPLSGDAQLCAWYLNELILRLLQRDDPYPDLYADYVSALCALARRPDAPAATLRRFERRLLEDLGYGLWLPEDLDPALNYRYSPGDGPVPVAGDDPQAYTGAALIALRDDGFASEAQARSLQPLLRSALRPLLGERPLQTARLWRSLHALQSSPGADSSPDRLQFPPPS